jgi:hypothetical protein
MTDAVFPPLANGQVSIDRLAAMFVNHVPDSEHCGECFAVFIWDEIPDTFIKTTQEGHPYGSTTAYETVVVGWECPVCGHYNSM